MMKEKKINRKKTHKEERRDLSLSLTLLHFLPPASHCLFSELFGFVCSKHSIKVYISYHLHDDRERERERERERTIKRERREKEEIFLLSLFL